jgi:hypothetical protein
MTHTPLHITIPEVQDEVRYAWTNSYSPAATERALDSIANEPAAYKISHLASRLFFRGIYFPQKGAWQWLKLIAENRRSLWSVVRDSFTCWHGTNDLGMTQDLERFPESAGKSEPAELNRAWADRRVLSISVEPEIGGALDGSGDA